MTSNEYIQIGAEGAEDFVQRFLSLDAAGAPLFLVTGHQAYESSGAASFFSSLLTGRQVVRFSDFTANPKIDELGHAIDVFKASRARLLLSVGGGSAIDLAKLVNYFAATGIDPVAYTEGKRGNGEAFSPLLAVPTTAGTGSEATHFAALYIGFNKISVAEKRIAPSHIWLNPTFTASLSPYLTACTGFDALAQAIESYWAVGSTSESRENSAKALQLCLCHLENAVLSPTTEHRVGMLEAAYLAGKAINVSKTTAAHAMSYSLTARYGLPHGHAVALTLPSIFEINAATTKSNVNDQRGVAHAHAVMNELCMLLGAADPKNAADRLRKLMIRIGLSDMWFSSHGFSVSAARDYVMKEVNEERLSNNPRRLDEKSMRRIVSHIR